MCFVSAVTTSDRGNSPATLQLVLLQVAAAATVRQHPCHHRPIGSACERHPNPAVQAPSHPCAGLLAQLRPASVQSVTWGWIFYTHQWSFQLTKYACWGIRSCQVFPWPGRRFGSYKKLIVADLQQQRLLQGTPREIKRACLSTCLRDKLLFDLPVSLSDSCTGS